MPDNLSVGFTPAHHGMKSEDALRSAIGGVRGEAVPSGSSPKPSGGIRTYHAPDAEVSAPSKGVHVESSSGEGSYMDNKTGEQIGLSEKLQRSGSGAPTSPEYRSGSGNPTSLAHMGGKNRFSNVKEQSLVPDKEAGGPTPIGNSSMGSAMSNIAAAGQKTVTEHGTYDQMSKTKDVAVKSGMPVSSGLQKGVAQGEEFKKQNIAPNLEGK